MGLDTNEVVSPFVFSGAVVEPSAVFVPFAFVPFGRAVVVVAGRAVADIRVSRVVAVVVAGRAVVAVSSVVGRAVAGRVNSLAVPVVFVLVVVWRRVGDQPVVSDIAVFGFILVSGISVFAGRKVFVEFVVWAVGLL